MKQNSKAPTFTKNDVYNILRKIYKTCRCSPENIKIKKIHKYYYGLYFPDSDEIIVDYRCPIISIFVHEMVHKFYPDKNETWVLLAEKRIMNKITRRQAKNLMKTICSIM